MKYLLTFFLIIAFFIKTFAQKKPNIVIFISDDLNQTDVGCYGNKDVHTPNIDKLAAEGMRFNSAYATSPMCTPSRSTMFTGLYPYRNGCQMNHFAVFPETKTLPQYLLPLGYRVVNAGKADFFPKSDFQFEYIGEEFGRYEPIETRTDPQKETVHFIEDYFKQGDDQPLCLVVAPWLPHVPWFPNRDFDPSRIKLPDYLVDTEETRAALASYYQSITATDNMVGEIMAAFDKCGENDNTVFIFFSDQGAQLPGAKWTAYDLGLRVPFIVRWPGKVAKGSESNALISLADLTPTVIDLAGGDDDGFDGSSISEVLNGTRKDHHDFIFAETSVEPQYWYNYTPSRTIITADGYHYIRNYYPGVRFVTHIDKMERNMYFFDSWEKKAAHDDQARFLLNRYSYHPDIEVYNLNKDRNEFKNLAFSPQYKEKTDSLTAILDQELSQQGETAEEIKQGQLPVFYDNAYEIRQNTAVLPSSFDHKKWNPDTLFVTAWVKDIQKEGLICGYFDKFRIFSSENKIGVEFRNKRVFYSSPVAENQGQLIFKLTCQGQMHLYFEGRKIITAPVGGDFTKIGPGYVMCGELRGEPVPEKYKQFKGKILNLRFTMNTLTPTPK